MSSLPRFSWKYLEGKTGVGGPKIEVVDKGIRFCLCYDHVHAEQIVKAMNGYYGSVSSPTPSPRIWRVNNEAEYLAGVARLEKLMDAKAGTPEGDELDSLSLKLERYEQAHLAENWGVIESTVK